MSTAADPISRERDEATADRAGTTAVPALADRPSGDVVARPTRGATR